MLVSAKPRREIRKPFIERLISDVGELRKMRLKAVLLDGFLNTIFFRKSGFEIYIFFNIFQLKQNSVMCRAFFFGIF